MKTYAIIKRTALSLAVLLTAGLAGGCNQTEIGTEPADNSGITPTTIQKGYLTDENSLRGSHTTEVRVEGNGTVSLYLRATKPGEGVSEVSLTYAPELVEAYNDRTGNMYEALPESQVTLPEEHFTLEASSQRSTALNLSYTLSGEQTAGNTYVIPLRATVVSGSLEMNTEDSEYLIFLNVVENPGDCNKGDDRSKVLCVLETNDVNPLNALSFKLKDSGKYFYDIVVLFSDNIILDETTGTVHALVNEQIKSILNNRDKYLKPLQDRGMKVVLAITPYHTHAGVANLMPATAEAFAKELKIICDTYSLDGVFFDDEYTALQDPAPTGFYPTNTAEAAADLMYRVKQLMPDRMVIAYRLGAIQNMTSEGCKFEDPTGKIWQPGDYIDYVMVDYSDSWVAKLSEFPGLPSNRFALHNYNFNSNSPSWPKVADLEEVRDLYKSVVIYGMNPFHPSNSFDTTPIGTSSGEKMTQLQALERVCETLFGEELDYDGVKYEADYKK